MKARRICFLLLAAVLLGAGLYTGEKIYYFALFVMAGMIVMSLINAYLTFFRLNYLQTLRPSVGVKGEDVVLNVEIHNDYLVPFPLIVLEYDLPDDYLSGVTSTEVAAVLPRSRYVLTRQVRCRFRGRYPVGMKSARFTDLFGLYAFTIRFSRLSHHRNLTLLVKPRIVSLPYLPLPVRESEGQVRTRLRASEDMTQMSDPRKYRTGDSLKKIHWKLTMRERELIVKNYEQSSMPDVLLYLDCHRTGLTGVGGIALEDMMVECATAVGHYVLQQGLPLRLIAYTTHRMELTGSRSADFASIYDFLAEVAFNGDFSLHDILLWELKNITQEGCLFVVAQDLTGPCFDTLMLLRRSGVMVTLILVHVPERQWDDEKSRMVHEMREHGISVVVMTPHENLADKVEALR